MAESDFELREILGEGATSVVRRAIRDGKSYALKLLKPGNVASVSEDGVIAFRREAAAVARLDHPNIVHLIEVGEHRGEPYLMMELVDGESLAARLARGPLAEADVLALARGMAGALAALDRGGVVHRDLKPANILYTRDGVPKIIDFGYAILAHTHRSDDRIAGTFLYSSPEQTGMLKRAVDGRADLYSLGCILYQAIAGRPPFSAASVAQLVQMHLTARPEPLTARPALVAIIDKLLAKDPDDRYQNGHSLLHDLEHLAEIESGAPLGARDARRGFDLPLIGRGVELARIHAAWAEARGGRGGAIQLEGEGGSGKTRLLRELVEAARGERALVLSGKAQQTERTPFGALREAIDDHVAAILRQPDGDARRQGLAELRDAAGDSAGIVRRISRSLERALGEAREVPPLDPVREQERFYDQLARFLAELARRRGAMVIVIDDVQWLDDGSREVLARLDLGAAPLLVATTARNDAASEGARAAFVAAMGAAIHPPIVLAALDVNAVAALIAAHLGGRGLAPAYVENLAAKANGNPFAVGEYVRALLDNGLLRPTAHGWLVDEWRFHAVALPDDVIQLLIGRTAALSPASADMLSTGAVIGFEFGIDLLAAAGGTTVEQVNRALEDGVRANLVERTASGHAFVHDRVHEALLARLADADRQERNRRVAEAQDRLSSGTPEEVYALAKYWRRAPPGRRHHAEVYRTSLAAGTLALESFANEEAFDLLEAALAAGTALGLSGTQLVAAREALGLAATKTGRVKLGHETLRAALADAGDAETQTRLQFLIAKAYASEGDGVRAWDELQIALARHGNPIPRSTIGKLLSFSFYLTFAFVLTHTGLALGRSRGARRKRRELLSQMQVDGNYIAYFRGDPLGLSLLIARELCNAHFLGAGSALAKALAWFAVFLATAFGTPRLARYYRRRSVTLAEQLGNPETLATARYVGGVAVEVAGDYQGGHETVVASADFGVKYMSAWDSTGQLGEVCNAMAFVGHARESLAWIHKYKANIQRGKCTQFESSAWATAYSQNVLLGNIVEAARWRNELEDILRRDPNVGSWTYAVAHQYSLIADLDQEELGEDVERKLAEYEAWGIDDYHTRLGYQLGVLIRVEQFYRARSHDADAEERKRILGKLAHAIKQAGMSFRHSLPIDRALVPIHRWFRTVGRSVQASASGRTRTALGLLDKAHADAASVPSPWGLWAVARQRARVYAQLGDDAQARRCAEAALAIARQNGWVHRAAQVEREFSVATPARKDSESSASSPLALGRQMDALLQVSLASASSLDPVAQSRAILDELVRVLSAERAFLFVVDGGRLEKRAGRDAHGADLAELTGWSTTVIDKVHRSRAPMVVTGTDEGEALGSESAVAHNLRSILAAPILLRDELLGVIYLDSTVAKGIFAVDDIGILTALANHIAIALETARAAQVEIEKESLTKDLEVSGVVQALLLPAADHVLHGSLELASFYRAAAQSGGDWWTYRKLAEGGLLVLVGDVSGHGVGAAMVTAIVAGNLCTPAVPAAPALLEQLNDTVLTLCRGAYLMTMSAVEIDAARGVVVCHNAGAPPVLIIKADGSFAYLTKAGSPLGSPELVIGTVEAPFAAGDRLLIFTDYAYQMKGASGERPLGLRGLQNLVRQALQGAGGPSLAGLRDALRRGFDDTLGGGVRHDDLTFVLIERHE